MLPFTLDRLTIIAPTVRNDGEASGYLQRVRDTLLGLGITGWTEYPTAGYWKGKRETGMMFEVFVDDANALAYDIGPLLRAAMPDQEAIQLTASVNPTTLYEA